MKKFLLTLVLVLTYGGFSPGEALSYLGYGGTLCAPGSSLDNAWFRITYDINTTPTDKGKGENSEWAQYGGTAQITFYDSAGNIIPGGTGTSDASAYVDNKISAGDDKVNLSAKFTITKDGSTHNLTINLVNYIKDGEISGYPPHPNFGPEDLTRLQGSDRFDTYDCAPTENLIMPIPGTIILLSSGLIGILAFRKRS